MISSNPLLVATNTSQHVKLHLIRLTHSTRGSATLECVILLAIIFLMLVRGKSIKGEEACIVLNADFPGNELCGDFCSATDELVAADSVFRVCMTTLLPGKTGNNNNAAIVHA